MSRDGKLIKNTAILAIGNICTKCISFLLLPLYTALLSKSEYGTIDVYSTIVNLLAGIFSLQLEYGLFRFLIDAREKEKEESDQYISSAILAVFFSVTILAVAGVLILLFIESPYKYFLILNTIVTITTSLSLQIARGIDRTADYAFGSFVCASLQIVLNVFFIAFIGWRVLGMLMSSFLAHFATTIVLVLKCKLYSYFNVKTINKEKLEEIVHYSLPLIPNNLCWWVVNASDRLVISGFLGTAFNGIYTVSCKFPSLFETIANIFILSWNESAAENVNSEDRNLFYSSIMKKSIGFFSTATLIVVSILPLIYPFFVNTSFADSYYQVPILMLGALFHAVSSLYGSIYTAFKKTRGVAKTTFVAAIINISINVVFIKQIGLFAASVSTLISYLVITIIRHLEIEKIITITYEPLWLLLHSLFLSFSIIAYYINSTVLSIFTVLFAVMVFLRNNSAILRNIVIGVYKRLKEKQD